MNQRVFATVLCLACFTLPTFTAKVLAQGEPYPQAMRDQIINSCEQSKQTVEAIKSVNCQCLTQAIEARYSANDYQAISDIIDRLPAQDQADLGGLIFLPELKKCGLRL